MNRIEDLRADYDALGEKLLTAEGSSAASIVRERRLLSELLEALEKPKEVPLVDQLAERRQSRTKSGGAASRRSKPG